MNKYPVRHTAQLVFTVVEIFRCVSAVGGCETVPVWRCRWVYRQRAPFGVSAPLECEKGAEKVVGGYARMRREQILNALLSGRF